MYVENLIGPLTVGTMPLETIDAFLDHGQLRRALDDGLDEAKGVIRGVEAEGISMTRVTDELISEGLPAAKSFDELIETIESSARSSPRHDRRR